MTDLGPLQLMRPAWLAALVALPLLAWWLRRRGAAAEDWQRAIDPHLRPYLIVGAGGARRGLGLLAAVAYVLAVIALAGPAWRQVDRPTWQTRLPLVVAVDLSSASYATDVPPSRHAQLRARLTRLLQRHRDGPIALVAFAADAFTVAPITDDAANVALFVDALQPDVMPVDGQSPARAIAWSRQLIERTGQPRGRIVLVTDHADGEAMREAAAARGAGSTVSVLGLGSAAGARVRTPSGGSVHVALDESSLRALARAGGGEYARLALDGADDRVFATVAGAGVAGASGGARTWLDEGFRLVPLLMLLALVLLARRPRAVAVLVVALLLPRPSLASDLWLRPDQRAHRAIDEGVDRYRRGDFAGAAQAFARADTADAHYDRGNALAKAGKLEAAIEAYDDALAKRPGMPDAVANRDAVVRALQRRQQGQGRQSGRNGGTSRQSQQGRACAPGEAGCRAQATPPPAGARGTGTSKTPVPVRPQDAQRQAQADAAQRERMRRALQQARGRKPASAKPTPAQRERQLSDAAALARVPDEPGSLLREKFRLENERRRSGGGVP